MITGRQYFPDAISTLSLSFFFYSSLMSPPRDQDLFVRRADSYSRSSLRRSSRLVSTLAEFSLRWFPVNCSILSISSDKIVSLFLIEYAANNGRRLTSAIKRFDCGSNRRGEDHGAPSLTVRSGLLSINHRRAIYINKMIHAGPTRSTRNREISVRSRFGIYGVSQIYNVIFQPQMKKKMLISMRIDNQRINYYWRQNIFK